MADDASRQFDALLRGLSELRDNPPPEPPDEDFLRAMEDVLAQNAQRRYEQLFGRLGWAEGDDPQ